MSSDLAVTDNLGLSPLQSQFIEELALCGVWARAARTVGVDYRTPRNWLKNNEAFKTAFNKVFGSTDLEVIRKHAETLSHTAMGVYAEVMEAEKTLRQQVQCPECGNRFGVEWRIEDNIVRLKAADSVTKIAGLVKDQKDINIKGTIIHYDGADAAALIAYKAGRPISPSMTRRLRELGWLEELPALPPPDAIEGEYRDATSPASV